MEGVATPAPEVSVADPSKHARDPVTVAKATLKADGKTVSLTIPGIKPVNCLVIKPRIATADGVAITAQINADTNDSGQRRDASRRLLMKVVRASILI